MSTRLEPVPVPRPFPRSPPGAGPVGSFPLRTNRLTLGPVSVSHSGTHPALAPHLLDALPAATLLIDAVGTILSASEVAAVAVGLDAGQLVGRSVLDFVDAETAWVYAATVAMATDYPDVIMGPMRITVVTAGGAHR